MTDDSLFDDLKPDGDDSRRPTPDGKSRKVERSLEDVLSFLKRASNVPPDQQVSSEDSTEAATAALRQYLQTAQLPWEDSVDSFTIAGHHFVRKHMGEARVCFYDRGPALAFLYYHAIGNRVKCQLVRVSDGYDALNVLKALVWGKLREFEHGQCESRPIDDYFTLANLPHDLCDEPRLTARMAELEAASDKREAESRKSNETFRVRERARCEKLLQSAAAKSEAQVTSLADDCALCKRLAGFGFASPVLIFVLAKMWEVFL